MKLHELFEGQVKRAAMDGTYQSSVSKPDKQSYTFLFYTANQYFHGSRYAKSPQQAKSRLMRALRDKTRNVSLTADQAKAKQIQDSKDIPRSSIQL